MIVDDRKFWDRVDSSAGPAECWPWTGARHERGYGLVRKAGVLCRAHRWAIQAPTDLHVMHVCDNPPCCNPAHLRLGTHAENMADMARKGRSGSRSTPTGEANHLTAITDAQVVGMRLLAEMGVDVQRLARWYGVHKATVQRIITGRSRATAGGPIRPPRTSPLKKGTRT